MLWGIGLDGWTLIVVILVGFSGLFVVASGLSTWVAYDLQKKEATDAAIALEKYKLATQGKVAEATKAGIDAGKEAGGATLKAAEANERAALAEQKTEQLRKENLELEDAVSPRKLVNQKGVADAMKVFVPGTVVVSYLPGDREAENLAGLIHGAFFLAGWRAPNVIEDPEDGIPLQNGIVVSVKWTDTSSDLMPADTKRVVAAETELLSQMCSRNIKIRRGFAPDSVPLGTLVIRVLAKPDPQEIRFQRERQENGEAPKGTAPGGCG
jgi:hypothetical protein